MSYYLGIDQGGTKTAAAVCDASGQILGAGIAGGACHQLSGMDTAMARVVEAARAALAPAGLAFSDMHALGGGISGVDWDYETPLVTEAVRQATGISLLSVKNDVFGAFYAGTTLGYGACICSGTDINVCAVAPDGRAYNFNFYCRVEHPGKMGLQCVFDSACGIRDETALTALALAHFDAPDVNTLLYRRVQGELSKPLLKRFAPVMLRAAAEGDAVAIDCARAYGRASAAYAAAGLRRFGMEAMPAEVVLSGGVFKTPCPPLFDTIEAEIQKHAPQTRITQATLEPVVGTLLIALAAAGVDTGDPSVRHNLRASAEAWQLIREGVTP